MERDFTLWYYIIMDLFTKNIDVARPLADRMRATDWAQFFGQKDIVDKDKILRQAINKDQLPSMIFWGPPGTGKTTLASIIANKTNSEFVQLSAVNSGKKDLMTVINNAKDILILNNQNQDKNIYIDLYKEGREIFITIQNNGGDIEDEIIDYIFDPYFSTKLKKNGTGLGLYIAKMIIEEHMGGELHVKNSDNGAIFTIRFEAEKS